MGVVGRTFAKLMMTSALLYKDIFKIFLIQIQAAGH